MSTGCLLLKCCSACVYNTVCRDFGLRLSSTYVPFHWVLCGVRHSPLAFFYCDCQREQNTASSAVYTLPELYRFLFRSLSHVAQFLNHLPRSLLILRQACHLNANTILQHFLFRKPQHNMLFLLSLSLPPILPRSPVCGENHVRSWTVTRFRGRISTQPGSVPISSFKVLSLDGPHSLLYPINSIGMTVQ